MEVGDNCGGFLVIPAEIIHHIVSFLVEMMKRDFCRFAEEKSGNEITSSSLAEIMYKFFKKCISTYIKPFAATCKFVRDYIAALYNNHSGRVYISCFRSGKLSSSEPREICYVFNIELFFIPTTFTAAEFRDLYTMSYIINLKDISNSNISEKRYGFVIKNRGFRIRFSDNKNAVTRFELVCKSDSYNCKYIKSSEFGEYILSKIREEYRPYSAAMKIAGRNLILRNFEMMFKDELYKAGITELLEILNQLLLPCGKTN